MRTRFAVSEDTSRDPTWNSVHTAALSVLPRALRLLGVDEPDIDDLCQEVLLAAYESLDRFDPAYPAPASPSPPLEAASADHPPPREGRHQHGNSAEARWVYGIAWRKVSHYLDRAHRRREFPNGLHPAPYGQPVDPVPSSEQRIAERERLALAIEVLGTIAPERRIVLVLHEAYEVPIVEIARELAINYNTACSRLRLAREDYRAAVQRLRPEQRQALRACWLPFLLASDFLAHEEGASSSAPPAPHAPAAATPQAPSPQVPAPPEPPAPPPRSPAPPGVPVPPAPPPRSPAPPGVPVPPAPPPRSPAPPGVPVPPAPPPRSPATPTLRRTLAELGPSLGSAAAGGVGTVALLVALAPPPLLWAGRFGTLLPEMLPTRGACLAAIPPPPMPEPLPVPPPPVPPAAEALHRPCAATSRTASPASEQEAPQDTFAQERRLLDAADETLAAGDPAGALRQLAMHEARFPAGLLKFVRERLRTVASTRLTDAAHSPSGSEPSR
ncbi:RNA polymerase sigma factor [Sorangium sp. So ce136]|uniref:RNA polymerase sigma factor n=1 Tax=Sorangium sp. So ce136 TaxID=3133284 RepID=UPI003F0688B3